MTGRSRVLAVQRQRQALELRLSGMTLDAIAQRLGYAGQQGAAKAITTALRATVQQPADEVRRIEVERLDKLLEVLWKDIADPYTKPSQRLFTVDRVLAVMDRRAKLLGLDAPQKIDVEHRIRAMAESHGMDPDEAVEEARRVLKESR